MDNNIQSIKDALKFLILYKLRVDKKYKIVFNFFLIKL